MKRGELYRVFSGSKTDTKKNRIYVIVSRQELIDNTYSTLICAPVYTNYEGLSTQVLVGVNEGLKHISAIRCDELISILKTRLTDYIGILSEDKLNELSYALSIAVGFDERTNVFFNSFVKN
ncbi:MAG: type II toxin-antitoxin system PemK/MazF family toxin [Treponema sp.]|nr:type II toxin-antitoxin system PemK/MazF family toxin [Treponema sp.]